MRIVRNRTSADCVIAAIACVADLDYDDVLAAAMPIVPYCQIEGVSVVDELRILDSLGIAYEEKLPSCSVLHKGNRYLITVPSTRDPLTEGHRLTIDFAEDFCVYDCYANDGDFYHESAEDALRLTKFYEVVRVIPHSVESTRRSIGEEEEYW